MNPRYLAYARTHGRSAPEMLAADEKDWPGGRMVGFQTWMDRRWRQWAAEHGYSLFDLILTPVEHADFDRWLDAYATTAEVQHPAPRSSKETP